jgi:hypothetical protein
MTLSFMRKTALALIAVSGLIATPSLAGGYGRDPEVIYGDDGYGVVRDMPVRPLPPRHVEPDWQQETDFISPRQISRMLRHQGYAHIAEFSQRGDLYRVIAVRRNGALVKLKIDAFDGSILSARRVGWAPRLPQRDRSGFTIEFGLN